MLVAGEPPGFADWSLMQNDEPISMAVSAVYRSSGKEPARVGNTRNVTPNSLP
jgi:hypothetical protein